MSNKRQRKYESEYESEYNPSKRFASGNEMPRFKTTLYRSINKGVECKYGRTCSFIHKDDIVFNEKKQCRFFNTSNNCKKGDKCMFFHDKNSENEKLASEFLKDVFRITNFSRRVWDYNKNELDAALSICLLANKLYRVDSEGWYQVR